MLNCYLRRYFTGIVILMLMCANAAYASVHDTTKTATPHGPVVTGLVVDENNRPVNGASVSVKTKAVSATTDQHGVFSINANTGDILVFSYNNHYVVEKMIANAGEKMHVQLLDRYLQNRDRIDVLYGNSSRENELGAVATIYTNQLTTTPASLYLYALPGQMAGLYTQQSSGFTSANNSNPLVAGIFSSPIIVTSHGNVPTDNTEMGLNIRGQGGYTTIIDGVQESITSIDPESIESISVLKDALSTVLLGINSSKPVLLITTKKAQIGAPRITFTTQAALQQSLGLPDDQLTAYQWAYLYNEALQNDGNNPAYNTADLAAYKNHTDPYGHPDVNWKKLLLKNYSPMQSDKLNVNGGTENARYVISLDYFDQGGIFKEASSVPYSTNNNLSRYQLNSNVDITVNKNLSVALQLYGRIEEVTEPGTGYSGILTGIFETPNNAYPVYNPDGSFGGSVLGSPFTNNLLSQAQYSGYLLTKIRDVLANLDLTYKLDGVTKGLSFRAKANTAVESQIEINRSFQNNTFAYIKSSDTTYGYSSVGSSAINNNTFSATLSARYSFEQASLAYERRFGKHHVAAQAFWDSNSLSLSYDLAAITTDRSFKGSYDYDGKYFAEGAVNYSGFNRYPPGRQNGWFWAGGLGWQMAKEDFMQDVSWIDKWKWRLTYGQTGNNNVGYYNYEQTYTSSTGYSFGLNRTGVNGYAQVNPLANPNETWEQAHKLDIGTDISLLKDKLHVTADYYHDLYYGLMEVPGNSIALLGASYPYENIGKNLYHGEELTITYQNHISNFNYFITGNGTIAASKIIYKDEEPAKYPWNARTGLPVNAIFGYKATGFYTIQDVANGTAHIAGYSPQPGDIKYADLNKDGVIDQYDQTAIGNLKPLVYYGATLGFNYKGFEFSMIIQGVFNRNITVGGNEFNGFEGVNSAYGIIPIPPYGQAYGNVLNRWTPETAATAAYPRLSLDNKNNVETFSSFDVKNGNYIRLKNAEIGYNLPNAFARRLRLSGIKVFADGENLYTIAGYKGFDGMDPEVYNVGSYPIQRVINLGLSVKL